MSLFTFIFDIFASAGLSIYEIVSRFLGWLKLHDFSGKKRRQSHLDDAPRSFAYDHLPVIIAADDQHTLLYNENGYMLQNRKTKITTPVSRKSLRRFVKKDLKALQTLSP